MNVMLRLILGFLLRNPDHPIQSLPQLHACLSQLARNCSGRMKMAVNHDVLEGEM
jgi:hypothetical protein